MDIIGGITAATEGLRLVNELRKIDTELDKAELKLRLIDLADKLVDAKQALQQAQDVELSLKREITALSEKLAQKPKLKDFEGLLFEVDDNSETVGAPYCNQCFVKEDKLYRLLSTSVARGSGYRCNNCGNVLITNPRATSPELRTGYDPLNPYRRR